MKHIAYKHKLNCRCPRCSKLWPKKERTIEHKMKLGLAHKGKHLSDKQKQKIREGVRKHSPSTIFKKGQQSWSKLNKDKIPHSENHPSWKGDKAGYGSKHDWIRRRMGKANYCSFDINHNSKYFEWANISGSYLRNINDYVPLCIKCHRQYDAIRNGYMLAGRRILA